MEEGLYDLLSPEVRETLTYRYWLLESVRGDPPMLKEIVANFRGIAVRTDSASLPEVQQALLSAQFGGEAGDPWSRAEWAFRAYSVILSAWLEACLRVVLECASACVGERDDWGQYQSKYDECAAQSGARKLCQLEAHDQVGKIRTLANCFKHRNARPSEREAEQLSVEASKPIVYLHEDWEGLTDAAASFVRGAIDNLPCLNRIAPIEWVNRVGS